MDEPVNEIEQAKPVEGMTQKPIEFIAKKKMTSKEIMKIALFIVIGLILIGSAAGAAYWWRDKVANDFEKKQATEISSLQNTKTSLEVQLADEKTKNTGTPATGATTCDPVAPNQSTIDNIKASITSGNTAALAGYSATTVIRVFVNTQGVMVSTPNQTVPTVTEFITSDNDTWDYNFALPAATLATYSSSVKYGKYFPSIAVVGKATNKKVISFSFDCDGKISTIFMADSGDIIK